MKNAAWMRNDKNVIGKKQNLGEDQVFGEGWVLGNSVLDILFFPGHHIYFSSLKKLFLSTM